MVYRVKEDTILVPYTLKLSVSVDWDRFQAPKGTIVVPIPGMDVGSTLTFVLTTSGDIAFTSMERLEIVT